MNCKLRQWWQFDFHLQWIFDEYKMSLLHAKTVCIDPLNLSSMHQCLSKNELSKQVVVSQIASWSPVQSSRPRSTSWPWTVRLLRFQCSIATSDGSAQKVGNNPWQMRQSEMITTKVCSQNVYTKIAARKPWKDVHWWNELWISIWWFLSILALKFTIHSVVDQSSTSRTQRPDRRSLITFMISMLSGWASRKTGAIYSANSRYSRHIYSKRQ